MSDHEERTRINKECLDLLKRYGLDVAALTLWKVAYTFEQIVGAPCYMNYRAKHQSGSIIGLLLTYTDWCKLKGLANQSKILGSKIQAQYMQRYAYAAEIANSKTLTIKHKRRRSKKTTTERVAFTESVDHFHGYVDRPVTNNAVYERNSPYYSRPKATSKAWKSKRVRKQWQKHD